MRFNEFKRVSDKKIDEVLPALAAAGARGAVGALAGAAVKSALNKGPNATVGTQPSSVTASVNKTKQQAKQAVTQQIVKKGGKLPMPTAKGQTKEFEIDSVKGDEVTLKNPDARTKPEEPEKVTYKKKDLDTIVSNLAQGSGE